MHNNKIQVLPPNISNQIAAGEVIQRPASVVKELIENAIDAKATDIQLIIKDAGKTLIQVIDNGSGMPPEDAVLSFEPHATSKIKTPEDLLHIRTMGFRGEALASIASIAYVQMKTKEEDSELGTLIEMEGNKYTNNTPIHCKKGTSIAVKNLFFNVPARRNFLKSDAIENNHILEEFIRTALIHKDISFTYYNNEKLIYNLEKQNLKKRIIDLFGKLYNERLLPIEEEVQAVKISGYIIKAEYTKRNKAEQYFFVNNRYMRNPYLANSIDRAYQGLIPEKTYPAFFIHLEVNPENIDVNIHPTKTEIKFLDDKIIYAVLHASAKKSLGQFTLATQLDFDLDPKFDFTPLKKGQIPTIPKTNFNPNYNPFETEETQTLKEPNFGFNHNKTPNFNPNKTLNILDLEESFETENPRNNSEIIQFNNKYILTKTRSNILIIHKERAFERILYERFTLNQKENFSSQNLLFPITHPFKRYKEKLLLLIPELRKYGFIIEHLKDENFNIIATPKNISEEETKLLIEEILSQSNDNVELSTIEERNQIALKMAKRLSSKENKELSKEQILGLIGELFACSNCEISPFGKKIIHKIELEEMEAFF
jgi:DNA mismatch repair protein MutL